MSQRSVQSVSRTEHVEDAGGKATSATIAPTEKYVIVICILIRYMLTSSTGLDMQELRRNGAWALGMYQAQRSS